MKKPRLSRKSMVLISCLCGLLAGRLYLGRISSYRQEISSLTGTREVLTAAGVIRAGELFTEDNVILRAVPIRSLSKRAIAKEDRTVVLGQKAFHTIPAGGEILWSDLPQTPRVRFPSEAVPPGQRAVSLAADEVHTQVHLLNPGDKVDIVWTGYLPGSTAPATRIVASGASVLAVGSEMGVVSGRSQGTELPLSITVLADRDTSLEILKYRATGEITLLARSRRLPAIEDAGKPSLEIRNEM